MLTPALLPSDSESQTDFGRLRAGRRVPRWVKALDHRVRLEFAAVFAELDRRRDHSRADVVPRCVEEEKVKGASELLVPDPLPVSVPGASDERGITLLKKIPVLEEGH